jgi:hypothetical protein
MRFMRKHAVCRELATLTFFMSAWLGCASVPLPQPWQGSRETATRISQEELASELAAFANRFAGRVSTAGEQIAASNDDPLVRRRAVLWGLRLNPVVREAAFLPNPKQGYLQLLTITVMMHAYLTEGDGNDLFGDLQPVAVSTSSILLDDALAVGARFIEPEYLAVVKAEVAELAARFPIQGTQFSMLRASEVVEAARGSGAFAYVTSLPLAPFTALRGVDNGAAAVRDFNLTAQRFSTVVAGLPETLRGEMQILLLDADDLRTLNRSVAALEVASASAARASLAMEQLPDQLRATLDEEVRALLGESQEALGRAEQALGHAEQALARAGEIAGPLQETALQIREASALWREILGPHDPSPRGADEAAFDIREWEDTAQAIGSAAAELRALAGELQEHSLADEIDRLFWRAVALLVVFFALLLIYRLITARMTAAR